MNLSPFELETLRYAERNNGRNFITAVADEPHNIAIHRLTEAGLFRDGGASASGHWRILTDAGRAALATVEGYAS